MSDARLKHYGWGREGEAMSADERAFVLGRYREKFGRGTFETRPPPRLEELSLPDPRVTPPASLAAFCTSELYDRAAHTYGKAYPDYVRAMLGQYDCAPDVVAYPRNEAEISSVIDWAGDVGASLAPFGGGSSVCGGVEHRADGRRKGAVTLDLRRLDKVLEVDATSRAARIEAGVFGPALEGQLKPHGLTLRHFPQSFEYSTLGGWIATRSGGHFASLYTHIDDLVESLRVVTPQGVLETRRLPGSGAGPSPDRLFIGSEGVLGVISQAWMRLQSKPVFRAGGSVSFTSFFAAARAVRAIAQAGLYPSNCRILDPAEAYNTGAAAGSVAVLVLAFESGDHPLEAWMKRALECCADHGGVAAPGAPTRILKALRACGATPSSECPTRGNSWRRPGSSMTLSRLRSPGSVSKRSTTPSRPRPSAPFSRRPASRGKSPAASRMSILTARRRISRSTRSAGTAR